MNSTVKQLLLWVSLLAGLFILWNYVAKSAGAGKDETPSLTQFHKDVDAGKVQSLIVNGNEITAKYKDNSKETFHVVIAGNLTAANYPELYKSLTEHGVDMSIKDQTPSIWMNAISLAASRGAAAGSCSCS